MNVKLPQPGLDDPRIRVNVSRTSHELAIVCVMNNRKDGCDVLAPVILPIGGDHDASDSLSSIVSQGVSMTRAGQLCLDLLLLLLKALGQGYTGCDPFVRHVTLALLAIFRHPGMDEWRTSDAMPGGLKPWQRALAMELLTDDVSSACSLDEVAQRCGLSTAHFCRAFAKSFGLPPHRWILSQRLEKARALLTEPSRSLADIAYECGFCDQSHLSHAFSRRFGMTPGAWRRDQQPGLATLPSHA